MIHFGIIYEMLFSKVQQNGYKVKIHYFQFIQKSFFFNEGFSLVDCCIIPILWRLPRLSIKLPKKALPVIEYAEKMFNRKSFQNSLLEFEKNMISNHRFF